jgi:hypothetical protein
LICFCRVLVGLFNMCLLVWFVFQFVFVNWYVCFISSFTLVNSMLIVKRVIVRLFNCVNTRLTAENSNLTDLQTDEQSQQRSNKYINTSKPTRKTQAHEQQITQPNNNKNRQTQHRHKQTIKYTTNKQSKISMDFNWLWIDFRTNNNVWPQHCDIEIENWFQSWTRLNSSIHRISTQWNIQFIQILVRSAHEQIQYLDKHKQMVNKLKKNIYKNTNHWNNEKCYHIF